MSRGKRFAVGGGRLEVGGKGRRAEGEKVRRGKAE